MRWLTRLFTPDARPILLRLDLGGQACPSSVDVETEWLPGGVRGSSHVLSSASMVLLPWRGDEDEARVSVRVGERVGRARVTRESNRDGCVLDLRLMDPSVARE